jgi:hypothetical protein
MERSTTPRGRSLRNGIPPGFPILQPPNAPLWIAFAATLASALTHGLTHAYARAIFFLSLTVWAYEEAAHGVNWWRRLLGVGFLAYLVVRLALALR